MARDHFSTADRLHMNHALRLSERGLGYTEPNPLVGAVAVRQGRVIGTGYHRVYGGPHAERLALESVRQPGATLYVTLEPCSHFGKTPPCCDFIIEKGVARVVTPLLDPNPLVNGAGAARLRAAGIAVEVGLLAGRTAEINRHYLHRLQSRRPYIAVHAGISLDGKMTDRNGCSRWITDEELRGYSHSLRGEFSAVLAGRITVTADDCRLTVRSAGWPDKKLYRVVLDPENSLSPALRIFQEQDRFPLILFSSDQAADQHPKCNHHFFIGTEAGFFPPADIARRLDEFGISSVLIEGGGRVIESFIRAGLVDEFYLFTAPRLIGGKTAVEAFAEGAPSLAEALSLRDYRLFQTVGGWIVQGRP